MPDNEASLPSFFGNNMSLAKFVLAVVLLTHLGALANEKEPPVTSQLLLFLSELRASSDSIASGGSLTIFATLANQSTMPTSEPEFFLRLYLSTDPVISSDDIYIGTQVLAPLAPNETMAMSTTLHVPSDTPPGSYYMGARIERIDDTPVHSITGPAIKILRDVDLTISALSIPGDTLPMGGKIVLSSSIRNMGSTPTTVAPIKVSFYLSDDADITPSDIPIGSRELFSLLPAGETDTAETMAKIPVFTSSLAMRPASSVKDDPGTANQATVMRRSFYLGAIIDADNVQPENNETNNAYPGPQLQAVRDVDLVVTRIETTTKAIPTGSRVGLKFTVKNQGSTPMTAPTAIAGIYLSSDNVITPVDTLLGMGSTNPLAAGASETIDISLPVPAGLVAGNYYLGVIANIGEQQPEKEKANNAMVGPRLNITP